MNDKTCDECGRALTNSTDMLCESCSLNAETEFCVDFGLFQKAEDAAFHYMIAMNERQEVMKDLASLRAQVSLQEANVTELEARMERMSINFNRIIEQEETQP